MNETTNKNIPATFDDLIDYLESHDHKHLQIFQFHNKPIHGFVEDERYLIVNQNGFGLYRLHNLDYQNGKIQLVLKHAQTGNPATLSLDIHDTNQNLFIISWNDIKEMVSDDCTNIDNELLELGGNTN